MKIRIQVSKDYQVFEVEQEIPQGADIKDTSAKLRDFANTQLGLLVGGQKGSPVPVKAKSANGSDKIKFADLMLTESQIYRLKTTMGYTEEDLKGKTYDDLDHFMKTKKPKGETQISATPQTKQANEKNVPWEIEL